MNFYKFIIPLCGKLNYLSIFKMFYAVKIGRQPGVYMSWAECESQVKGYSKPMFKKFSTEDEAWEYINEEGPSSEVPQETSTAMPHTSAFCESLNTVKFTAISIQNQMEMMASTFGSLCKQIEHLETLASSMNAKTFSTSICNDFVGQFSSSNARMKTRPSSLKRSFTDGPCPVETKSTPMLKKSKTNDKEENWTGSRFDESEGTVVYTDGACSANGKNGAMAGIGVYWGPGNVNNVSERLTGRPTNNRAEIHAASKAVVQAKRMGIKKLILHTDSQFLINSITKWINGWKKNGWVLTTGKPVINREDFEQLDKVINNINIKWVYVRGHRGIKGNEEADSLATAGARKCLPK